MKSIIRKCSRCGTYTMREVCSVCGQRTSMAIPPKYSENDRFQKYRIMQRGVR